MCCFESLAESGFLLFVSIFQFCNPPMCFQWIYNLRIWSSLIIELCGLCHKKEIWIGKVYIHSMSDLKVDWWRGSYSFTGTAYTCIVHDVKYVAWEKVPFSLHESLFMNLNEGTARQEWLLWWKWIMMDFTQGLMWKWTFIVRYKWYTTIQVVLQQISPHRRCKRCWFRTFCQFSTFMHIQLFILLCFAL